MLKPLGIGYMPLDVLSLMLALLSVARRRRSAASMHTVASVPLQTLTNLTPE
jgi:hypothetical protein